MRGTLAALTVLLLAPAFLVVAAPVANAGVCVDTRELPNPSAVYVGSAQCDMEILVLVQSDGGSVTVQVVVTVRDVVLVSFACTTSVLHPDGNPDAHVGPFYPNVDRVDNHSECMA